MLSWDSRDPPTTYLRGHLMWNLIRQMETVLSNGAKEKCENDKLAWKQISSNFRNICLIRRWDSYYSVAEMIPVIAPHALQTRKQVVAFVGATPMVAKVGSNNLVSAGNIQFMSMLMFGRPDFLKPALVLMYKRRQQILLHHQLTE